MSEVEVKKTIKKPVMKKAAVPTESEVKPAPVDVEVSKKPRVSKAKSAESAPVVPVVDAPVVDAPDATKGSKTTGKNIDTIVGVLISKFNLNEKAVREAIAPYLPMSSMYKKKKAVRDPEAPKKYLSSYMHYATDARKNIQGKEGKQFVDVTREVAEQWKHLSPEDKKKYEDIANKDKERFEGEDAAFRVRKGLPPRVKKPVAAVVAPVAVVA